MRCRVATHRKTFFRPSVNGGLRATPSTAVATDSATALVAIVWEQSWELSQESLVQRPSTVVADKLAVVLAEFRAPERAKPP